MLGREPTAIPFSADAMKASLLRLEGEWGNSASQP